MKDDYISRQDAIDAANRADYRGLTVEDVRHVTDEVVKELKRLPSAEPKTGKWILSDNQSREDMENGNYYYVCSNCLHGDVHAKTQEVPYCWYCGSYNGGTNENMG